MGLMLSKESHCFNTSLLLGTRLEIVLSHGQSQAIFGHFLWQFSSLKNWMGFFYSSSWAHSLSWETDLGTFDLTTGLFALPTALVLRLVESSFNSEVGKYPKCVPCSSAVSQLHLHNRSIIPFIKFDIFKTRYSEEMWELGHILLGLQSFSFARSPNLFPMLKFSQKNQLSNPAGLTHQCPVTLDCRPQAEKALS